MFNELYIYKTTICITSNIIKNIHNKKWNINIKGVGDGAKNFIKCNYFSSLESTYPTDRNFQKGLKKIYKLEKITVIGSRKLIEKWKGHKYWIYVLFPGRKLSYRLIMFRKTSI